MLKIMRNSNNSKGETIQRIITAAQTEFADKGYDGTSLSNIACNAGVTKQLLHYYFSNKDELYLISINEASQTILQLYDKASYDALSPTEAISLLINRIIDLHIEMPALTKITLDQGIHHAAHINEQLGYVPSTKDFINNVIDPLLRRGVLSGEFRSNIDAGLLYTTVYHIASGCFLIGSSMNRTVPGVDFTSPEGVEIWRAHSVNFILSSLRA